MDFLLKGKEGKVIRVLRKNFHKPLSIQEISTQSGVPYTSVFEALSGLAGAGVVLREKRGKAHLYGLDWDSRTCKATLNLLNELDFCAKLPEMQRQPAPRGEGFECLLNNEALQVARDSAGNAGDGKPVVSFEDFERNLRERPELLEDLTVSFGFGEFYDVLSCAGKSARENLKGRVLEEVEGFESALKLDVDGISSALKEGNRKEAVKSMRSALENAAFALAVLGKRKVVAQNLPALEEKFPEIRMELEAARKLYGELKDLEDAPGEKVKELLLCTTKCLDFLLERIAFGKKELKAEASREALEAAQEK